MNQKNKLKNIYSKIDKVDYVSFDMFDTLVKRDCINPTDIFSIVELKYNKENKKKIKNFEVERKIAEKKARTKLSFKFEDINLEEIYEFMPFTNVEKEKLKQLEISTEFEYCKQNKYIYEIYKYCKLKRKKIICTSNMYLSNSILKNKQEIFSNI